MVPTEPVDSDARGVDPPGVVFIMGAARSGSTLLGTLLGQAEGLFFAGELCDWAHLDGASTVTHSKAFWERVRSQIGPLPAGSANFKRLFEHPAGIVNRFGRRHERPGYERLTLEVLKAIAQESGSPTIVDSSHYPRRARALRRLLGPEKVRLVFLVRRPSFVAQSFRKTGDKGVVHANLYMMVVSILAWFTYLTHLRANRTIVSYEKMIKDPLAAGWVSLGKPLVGVDPYHMSPPLVLVGNRFVKTEAEIKFNTNGNAQTPNRQERFSDFVQWPLRLAALGARSRP